MKTCPPEVAAMQSKPKSYLPGTRTWNPAYGKWYYWKNREKQLKQAKEWREQNKELKSKMDREYRAKNLVKLKAHDRMRHKRDAEKRSAAGRAYYKKNRERVKQSSMSYWKRMRKDPKYVDRQKLRHQKRPGKKKTKGTLYFFRSITPGFYKVGCTTNWTKRQKTYTGPNTIGRLVFARPVPDMFYAETHMKIFLRNHEYKQFAKCGQNQGDWFVRENEKVF